MSLRLLPKHTKIDRNDDFARQFAVQHQEAEQQPCPHFRARLQSLPLAADPAQRTVRTVSCRSCGVVLAEEIG